MFYKIDYSNFLYENNTSVVIHIESFFAVTKFAFLNQRVPEPFHSNRLCCSCTAKVVIFHCVKVFFSGIFILLILLSPVHYKLTSY